MKALLLNGWGVTADAAAAAIPRSAGVELEVIPAASDWRDRLEQSSATVLVGYSTGAFLALSAVELWERFDRVVLFAPFTDYKAEATRGGRIKAVQLKYLLRGLKRDALAAVQDFYDHAGLKFDKPDTAPLPVEDLRWGIERLLLDQVDGEGMDNAECYVGADDRLLDAQRLLELHSGMRVVENAGHDLRELTTAARFVL